MQYVTTTGSLATLIVLMSSLMDAANAVDRLPVGEITVRRDVAYRPGPSPAWRLDLAMPKAKGDKPRPGIVVIHGGGWLEGDKSSFVFTDRSSPANIVDFARLGFVAVSINYRMSREAPFPAAVEDCKAAVRWLRGHAKEFHLNPNQIGAYGNSAGGHLALMLAMADKTAGLEGDGPFQDQSSLVQAAVSDSGPVDLAEQARESQIHGVVKQFLGGPPEGDRLRLYQQASPVNYISTKTPALLLIYGAADMQIPIITADEFVLKLAKVGAQDVTYHRLAFVDHCPHTLVALPEMQSAIEAFFLRTLMHPETARTVRTWKRLP